MAEIKNLRKVAERILRAIKNQEKIILYGDADLDGVSSVIILKESIEKLAGSVACVYFPDREKEGYGINESALKYLKKYAPALFISLDCGISNFKEINLAKKMGFEVIVVDHHEILEKLPSASIIVDPKQEGDKYPFKNFACAGVAYKLVKTMLSKENQWDSPEKFLELAALATLADQMPLIDENEKLIKEGILALNYTRRPGLQALMKLTAPHLNLSGGLLLQEIQQKIISPLNSTEPCDHLNQIYLLLTENSFAKAQKLAKVLIKEAEKKREELKRVSLEVQERIIEDSEQTLIFDGDSNWPLISLGSVASKVCHKYKKPVFLYKIEKEKSQGTVRCPAGLNGVKAMLSCKSLLETYGGHPAACGFRIKNENLEKFEECLTKYFKK